MAEKNKKVGSTHEDVDARGALLVNLGTFYVTAEEMYDEFCSPEVISEVADAMKSTLESLGVELDSVALISDEELTKLWNHVPYNENAADRSTTVEFYGFEAATELYQSTRHDGSKIWLAPLGAAVSDEISPQGEGGAVYVFDIDTLRHIDTSAAMYGGKMEVIINSKKQIKEASLFAIEVEIAELPDENVEAYDSLSAFSDDPLGGITEIEAPEFSDPKNQALERAKQLAKSILASTQVSVQALDEDDNQSSENT